MKKLLFVSPDYGYFPLSGAFVVTTMRRAGIAYDFLDLHRHDDFETRILSGEYWGVATTGLVLDFNKVAKILHTAKSLAPQIVTLLGGRICYTPLHLLESLPVDYIVVGEAEGTMQELVAAILSGEKDFSRIKSIIYRDGESRLVQTQNRKLRPLDNFEPTWDDIDMQHYISSEQSRNLWANSFPLVSGMGCMGKCSFCLPGIRGVRVRPVPHILNEMQTANERYDFSYFSFRSEVFYSKYQDVKDFCEGYLRTGIDKPWVCSMRVDFDTRLLSMMADAGVRYIFIGLESFDDTALQCMGKNTNEAMIDTFINEAQKCGIDIIAGLMAGNIGDSPQAVSKTVDYVNRKGVIAPSISPLCVYPGTQVYKTAIEKRLIKDEAAYCNSIFSSKWETSYFGPLYPNVTDYPMAEWWDAYLRCRYKLETHVAIQLQSKGFDAETETTCCHSCGNPIKVVRGSVRAHVCKKCVTMNLVNVYLATLKSDPVFPRIRKAMLSAKRVGVMGGLNFAKALLFISTEIGIDPARIYIVGDGAELIANVPRKTLTEVAPEDTVLLAGVHCPDALRAALAERGIRSENVHNLMPPEFKQWLKSSFERGESYIEFTSMEDIEFFGMGIAEHLSVRYGSDARWAILPAGAYGLAICKGFQDVGVEVVALADSYKSRDDLDIDIQIVKPTMVGSLGVVKALVCTPIVKLQEELREVLVNGGMRPEDVVLLRDMYTELWDSFLCTEAAST